MSHEIDVTTGTPAIAYVGQKPWHGLGTELQDGADIDTWRRTAQLDWKVQETPVYYVPAQDQGTKAFPSRKALLRGDNLAPLSIVSHDFNVVQPGDVLEFFRKLTESHGFKLETAGALRGGRRIWAMARVAESFKVVDDEVRPYVLLSTAYDATMATWARNCYQRVVCANTIAMAETESGKIIRVPHNAKMDFEDLRLQLGLALNSWERFKVRAMRLAEREMPDAEAESFLRELLGLKEEQDAPRGFVKIMSLFKGAQLGAERKSTRQTMWGMVQAVAQHVDHNPYARSAETRLDGAWFGWGNELKVKAFVRALKAVEPANDAKVEVAA